MADISKLKLGRQTKEKGIGFLEKIESDMSYESNYTGDMMDFEWLEEIEDACPYIDIIVRVPKNTLIREENVMLIERAKKINVSSVKDLAKHTEYINKYDKNTSSVEPSKILDIRNEETYNIYENRFLYTLIDTLDRFLTKKEKLLKNFEISDSKLLEYASNTCTKYEEVSIEVKLKAKTIPSNELDKKIKDEIDSIKKRLKRVREYIASWQKSEMVKALSRAHVKLIEPPIKKTNIILKNQNFKIAVKLWEYLLKYDYEENEDEQDNFVKKDDDILMTFLDQAFLINYFVSDSTVPFKREQKKKMAENSLFILKRQIEIMLELFKSMGFDLSDEELLKIVVDEMKNERGERLVGMDDVKKKFQNAMEEYLERTQENL